MKPIRVLHMIGSLNSGGSQTFVMNIYRNIDRSKIQFDFIIDRAKETFYLEEIKKLGGKVFILKNINECSLNLYYKQWDDFFKTHKEYKIIHGHVRSVAAIYLRIAKKYGLTAIVHSHSTSSGSGMSAIVKNILQLPIRYIADYLFACSDEAGKWLYGKSIIYRDNYQVINNAINAEEYVFNSEIRNRIRQELDIEKKFVIGHVGRFSYPKNHKLLIEIFNEIQEQNNNAVLLLIGDGELRPQIEKQIEKLGIKHKVILMGVVSNVNEYMQAMDVFIFPSIFEGLGIAAIEAQASGLPCIVSDNIPREAFVTNLIKSIPIEDSIKLWCDQIFRQISDYERKNMYLEIKKSGYDIKENAGVMEKFYGEVLL